MLVCLQCVSESLKCLSHPLWDTGVFVAVYVEGWMLLVLVHAHVCLLVCTVCVYVRRCAHWQLWPWEQPQHCFNQMSNIQSLILKNYQILTKVNMQQSAAVIAPERFQQLANFPQHFTSLMLNFSWRDGGCFCKPEWGQMKRFIIFCSITTFSWLL